MATLIHKVAHGLIVSQPIMFSNLVGGEGLEDNTVYYVLAAGLTADDFAVSLSDGGAAVVYTTDITGGDIVAPNTYQETTSEAMTPPTTLSAPDTPVLTSFEAAGVVRLLVEVPAYDDPAVRIRAIEVTVTMRFDAGSPVYDGGQILTLPAGVNSISIPAFGDTLYNARARAQDVYGNFSDYSADGAVTTDPGVDSLVIADDAITETKIADGSISTPKLQARSITADLLAATITLTSLLKTATSGRRIELDVDGIRLYDTDESLLVRIPTNGDPVYVKGQVNADSLVSQTSAQFRTAVSLDASSTTTLQSGVSNPSTAPTVVASLQTPLTLTTTPSATSLGLAYDAHAGGGDTGIPTFWLACDPSSGYVAAEYNASSGALRQRIPATDTTATVTTTYGSTSHISDTAEATSDNAESQIAVPIVMPRDGRITKVSIYLAGYSGSATIRNCVWSNGGTLIDNSASYVASSAALGAGNSSKYDKALANGAINYIGGNTYKVGAMLVSDSDSWQWDRDDGSSKTTYLGSGENFDDFTVTRTETTHKPNVYITYEYDIGSILEANPMIGVAQDGTYVYTLDSTGVVWKYDRTTLAHVAHSSVQTAITGAKANAGLFYDATAGELIITTATGTGAGVYPKFVRVDPSTLAVSSTVYSAAAGTTFNGTTDTFRGGARVNDALNGSAATYWVATTSKVYAYTFSGTTATQTSDRDFGQSTTTGDGLTYDGSVFRGFDAASLTTITKFTSWDWTTASAVYWFCYAWYDSAGTTHETAVGPRSSLTLRRRERVQVTTPTIPTGGADDPDKVRIYIKPNSTDPGAGNFKKQVEDTATARYLTTYDSAGAADGGGTVFPAGTPATLASAKALSTTNGGLGFAFYGDGSIRAPYPKVTVLTSGSGATFTPSTGVNYAVVECVGGGGGGAGAANSSAGNASLGTSGGGGGYARKLLTRTELLAGAITYTVGTGGAGVSGATAPNAGNNTTFAGSWTGSPVQGSGGSAGIHLANGSSQLQRIGGTGGGASGGDINIQGGAATDGYRSSTPLASTGNGGNAGGGMGAGGRSNTSATGNDGSNGNNGVAYGGGGGGAFAQGGTTAKTGGSGADGVIIVTEYFGA